MTLREIWAGLTCPAGLKIIGYVGLVAVVVGVGLPVTARLERPAQPEAPAQCGSTPCPDWDAVAKKERARATAERAARLGQDLEKCEVYGRVLERMRANHPELDRVARLYGQCVAAAGR